MLRCRVVRASADSPPVVRACSVCLSYALDAAEHICRTLFTTLPETDAAVLSLPRSVDVFAPLNASFEEVPAVTGDGGASPPSVTTPSSRCRDVMWPRFDPCRRAVCRA